MKIRDWDTNLKIRLGGEAVVNITYWMFFPFLTIYFSEEFGKTTAGFLMILSQCFAVTANLMGGYCADRFGRKRMMLVSTAGQGCTYFIFALSSSPWLDSAVVGFICFSIVSMFSSFYWPASQAMIADVVKEENRSDVFAIFYTSLNLAVVIGPILGSIFYKDYRFELLLMASITNLFLSWVIHKWIVETAPNWDSKQQNTIGGFQFLKNQLSQYTVIFKDLTFLLFIIAGTIGGITYAQLDLLFAIYTKDVIHDQTLFSIGDWTMKVSGESAYGLLISENGLIVVIFTVLMTKWMNRYSEKNVFIASSLVYGCSMLLTSSTNIIWGLLFAMAVFTIGELMTVGIQNSFVSKIAPEHMRAQYFAAASLRYTTGRMIAPIAIPFTQWFGYTATFVILSGFSVISAIIYWIMFQRYDKENRHQPNTV